MRKHALPSTLSVLVAVVMAALLLQESAARGQSSTAPPASASDADSGFTVRNSSVGYIDCAIPFSHFRFRYDPTYNNRRPSRAEFFYAKLQPGGPGLPKHESGVDYQDLSAYLEVAAGERLSAFVELPMRFLNPEINANHAGIADMNAGFKLAFVRNESLTATVQFRTYVPTGDSERGLGTNHVSLEPAILVNAPLTERLTFEGELRDWVPVGGTDFAGNVVRYGAGLSYNLIETCRFRVTPVAEFVGWTVLDGKVSAFLPPPRDPVVTQADGDTIVNIKLGARVRFGEIGDIYAGWGRPLTGDRWYENVVRLELRLFF